MISLSVGVINSRKRSQRQLASSFSHNQQMKLYMFHSYLYISRRLDINHSYQGLLLPYRQHTCTWTNTELHLTDMKNHLWHKLFKDTNIFSNLLYSEFSLSWIQLPLEGLRQPYRLHQLQVASTNLLAGQELLWCRDIADTLVCLALCSPS